jgi:tRNA (guanine37-N1)-methyltransferase
MRIDVITIFPGMLEGFLGESMMKRAAEAGLVDFHVTDLRDFTDDAHRTTDDRPYGGGPGMVMKAEPLFRAVEALQSGDAPVILMTPQGKPFKQADAHQLTACPHLIFITGHYEGVDERVRQHLVTHEISIGDYVLTNGVLPAAVVIDALVRLIPGVLGAGEPATQDESFQGPRLEGPQYTRPAVFRDMAVPEVLLSGNHQQIAAWREQQSLDRTRERRPDLLD